MVREKTVEGTELNTVERANNENMQVKKTMAIELKEGMGLSKEAICRILHLNREEISLIFSRTADRLG